MAKRIAVIGAGASGGVALDSFLAAGFTDVTVFERQKTYGGTWNLDHHFNESHKLADLPDLPGIERLGSNPNPPVDVPEGVDKATASHPLVKPKQNFGARFLESSMYPQVETNISSELMHFSKYPLPAIYPPKTKERFGVDDAYRTHDVIRKYVRQFLDGREKYIQFNTTVERARQVDGPGSKWELAIRRSIDDDHEEWWTETFDFVYAASGRFYVPRIPDIKGLKETAEKVPKRTIIHTKVFRGAEDFKGKKVLLVGASWSNSDVAHLSKEAGAQLPIHVSLRHVLGVAMPSFAQPWIEAHEAIDSMAPASDGKSVDVTFLDGSKLENVENIVFGTGYRISYPYLEHYLSGYGGIHDDLAIQTRNLYWTTWWNRDPSLAISSILTEGVTWRVIETQAKASAGLWKRPRSTWFTYEEAVAWEQKRRDLNLRDFHIWYPNYDELLRGLSAVGQLDVPDELPPYVEMFQRSLGMKMSYFSRISKETAEEHPEWNDRLERTTAFLEKVKIQTNLN